MHTHPIRVIAHTGSLTDQTFEVVDVYEMRGDRSTWRTWWGIIRFRNRGCSFRIERSNPLLA